MAHTVENANLVWQKVKIALANSDPTVVNAFRSLKADLAQRKGNPDLKFTPFDITTNGSGDGNADVVAADAAATLVAIYAKKGTGAVLGYDAISNHASAIQAQKEVLAAGTVAGVKKVLMFPDGLAFATGITYASVTAYNGTTHSLTANSSDGFILTRTT